MSELRKQQIRKEEAWADQDRNRDDDAPEPYEQTYRDGSLKNECWRSDDHCFSAPAIAKKCGLWYDMRVKTRQIMMK